MYQTKQIFTILFPTYLYFSLSPIGKAEHKMYTYIYPGSFSFPFIASLLSIRQSLRRPPMTNRNAPTIFSHRTTEIIKKYSKPNQFAAHKSQSSKTRSKKKKRNEIKNHRPQDLCYALTPGFTIFLFLLNDRRVRKLILYYTTMMKAQIAHDLRHIVLVHTASKRLEKKKKKHAQTHTQCLNKNVSSA